MKNKKISFLLTSIEMRLIESVIYLEPWLQDNIEHAKLVGGKYKITFNDYDLDDFLGAISFDAQCGPSPYKRKEMLADLYRRLTTELRQNRVEKADPGDTTPS